MERNFAALSPAQRAEIKAAYRVAMVLGLNPLWTDSRDDYIEIYSAALCDMLDCGADYANIVGANLAWARLSPRS